MSLNTIQIGQEAMVKKIELNPQTLHRLRALGMLEGTIVKVVQRKRNGTLVINLRGTRFALGKEITRRIEVETV
ncbi:FeoA family protein [uncultured Dubosiella sp.]|uniref:FeoA family protein n=1 Tax=uncultured Dubosiella sp. TaxID=1937011 RepID=UPI0025953648|nr:FeoA family protein [uncultured Dubosiella sp.]